MSVAHENDSQRIRNRMQRLRRRMDDDVQGLVENTQRLFDWKDYVRQYPLGAAAAGVAIGFFFSPGRKVVQSVKLADESVQELREQRVQQTPGEQKNPIPSMLTGAVNALSGIALSSLATIVRHRLERYLAFDVPARETYQSDH
ncbi:MAG: hypothetical protein U0903_01920 [Planctomycetales bacterium]